MPLGEKLKFMLSRLLIIAILETQLKKDSHTSSKEIILISSWGGTKSELSVIGVARALLGFGPDPFNGVSVMGRGYGAPFCALSNLNSAIDKRNKPIIGS